MKSYKNINDPQRSFVAAYVEKHTERSSFFSDVKRIIDWKVIDLELKKVYKKGLKERGAKAYSPLLLFKMQLISIWYNLSDMQTEIMVNDSLSAMKFCNLTIEDSVPGHSTLSRFKKVLNEKGVNEEIVQVVNDQLASEGYQLESGKARIDARLVKA